MSKNVNRRKFLKASLLASTGVGLSYQIEEDVTYANEILANLETRVRPWRA